MQDQEHPEEEIQPGIITAPPAKGGNADQDWDKQHKKQKEHMEDPRKNQPGTNTKLGEAAGGNKDIGRIWGPDGDLDDSKENDAWDTLSNTEERHM